MAAHQDNHTRWEDLTRATQLNLACDAGAKAILQQEAFPLKLICMFIDGKKMTLDTRAHIWDGRSRGPFFIKQAG